MVATRRPGSWGDGAPPLDCFVFMLVRNGHVLAEKRKATRRLAPGAIALPGGHVDGDEGLEAALERELHEELGIVAERIAYVCTLLHRAEEFRKLLWTRLDEPAALEIDVDRTAIAEYLRLSRSG